MRAAPPLCLRSGAVQKIVVTRLTHTLVVQLVVGELSGIPETLHCNVQNCGFDESTHA